MNPRKKPFKMLVRVSRLFFSKDNRTDSLVQKSYDRISAGYDETWTDHMRDLTSDLIGQLEIKSHQKVMDLTCGTGYATGLIAQACGAETIGVDNSKGMLEQAQQNCPATCTFIQSDILQYLTSLPSETYDVITCCWGLGYSKPLNVLRQIRRVLKPGGKIGIIDNTLFSLREVMYCSTLAFMEQPEKLRNLMKFRFLTGQQHLWLWLRLAGIKPMTVWGGSKTYEAASGVDAIERLRATGAAAGFEFAADDEDAEEVFRRFAEILEQKYRVQGQIPITHRYCGGIGIK